MFGIVINFIICIEQELFQGRTIFLEILENIWSMKTFHPKLKDTIIHVIGQMKQQFFQIVLTFLTK